MTTALTTIKVDKSVRDQLADVARSRHTTMRALLADVVGELAREEEWSEIEAAYARLRADAAEWADYRADIERWESGASDVDHHAADEFPEYQQ